MKDAEFDGAPIADVVRECERLDRLTRLRRTAFLVLMLTLALGGVIIIRAQTTDVDPRLSAARQAAIWLLPIMLIAYAALARAEQVLLKQLVRVGAVIPRQVSADDWDRLWALAKPVAGVVTLLVIGFFLSRAIFPG
jgi:hypothetical protein